MSVSSSDSPRWVEVWGDGTDDRASVLLGAAALFAFLVVWHCGRVHKHRGYMREVSDKRIEGDGRRIEEVRKGLKLFGERY